MVLRLSMEAYDYKLLLPGRSLLVFRFPMQSWRLVWNLIPDS